MSAVRELLQPAIVNARTPAQLEALAQELRSFATTLDDRAAALRRNVRKPATARIGAGKGGRPSLPYLVIAEESRPNREANIRVRLSRALYTAAGSPAFLNPQRFDGRVVLTPGPGGYTVIVTQGGIWFFANASRDLLPSPGTYAATVEGHMIIIQDALLNNA